MSASLISREAMGATAPASSALQSMDASQKQKETRQNEAVPSHSKLHAGTSYAQSPVADDELINGRSAMRT
jgi:hypothetical protein